MADVNRTVETRFNIAGNASKAVGALGGLFSKLGGVIGRVTRMVNPLSVAIGGLGTGVASRGILKLHDEFERTQITMAGFMTALGAAGDYAEGLRVAESTMRRIRIDSAALPGEAEDYIHVFQMGLPVVQTAIGGTIKEMTDFTNRYTAITDTLGVDSAQAARDLNLMLKVGQGRAGGMVKSFSRLLPFMRQMEGQSELVVESFNKMTAPERAKLMLGAFEQLDPMLQQAAGSFDAMAGAIKSNTKEIIRLGTKPLFEATKVALEKVNSLLYTQEGALTGVGWSIVDAGKKVSDWITGAIKKAIDAAERLREAFEAVAASDAFRQIRDIIEGLAGVTERLGGGIMGLVTGGGAPPAAAEAAREPPEATGLAGAFQELLGPVNLLKTGLGTAAIALTIWAGLGPVGMLISGALMGMAGNTETVSAIWDQLVGIVNTVIDALGPVIDLFMALSGILGDVAGELVTALLDVIGGLLGMILPIIGGIAKVLTAIINGIRPYFGILARVIGIVVRIIGAVLVGVLWLVVTAAKGIAMFFDAILGPTIAEVGKGLDWLAGKVSAASGALGALIAWIRNLVGGLVGEEPPPETAAGGEEYVKYTTVPSRGAVRRGKSIHGGVRPRGGGGAGGARGAGGRATNDFRFSRFEITQKFEEGFDPDRIAIAFSQDLGRIAEQRLQSGFDPIFAIR
jgi:phage-related protein